MKLRPREGGGEQCKSALRKETFRWQLVASREVSGSRNVTKSRLSIAAAQINDLSDIKDIIG